MKGNSDRKVPGNVGPEKAPGHHGLSADPLENWLPLPQLLMDST